ncbi:MAG: hypothetical protein E6J88_03895 [Deltaproteobacteria bacterium]|nr:MAG: hypothetical protein E6J88_03895 [Deltaproteobacteria bacterium]
MLRRLFALRSILFLAAAPVLAQDRADAVLVLADDGALDAPAVHAIRNVAASRRWRPISARGGSSRCAWAAGWARRSRSASRS